MEHSEKGHTHTPRHRDIITSIMCLLIRLWQDYITGLAKWAIINDQNVEQNTGFPPTTQVSRAPASLPGH